MRNLFNDTIVQGALAVLIGVLILGIFGWLKFKRDEKIVTWLLKKSGVETGHTTKVTPVIPSDTHPSGDSKRQAGSKDIKNKRNRKGEES